MLVNEPEEVQEAAAISTTPTTTPTPESPRIAAPPRTRQPLSPKNLTPLVIPIMANGQPRLTRQLSLTRLRSGSTPVEPSARSARTDDYSPKLRTPYTPLSAASTLLTTPRTASTSGPMTGSTLPTPVSAGPWSSNNEATTPGQLSSATSPNLPTTPAADPSATPKAPETEPRPAAAATSTPMQPAQMLGHRRNQSESASMMERGRPSRRNESIAALAPVTTTPAAGGLKRAGSRRSKSAERRAFEQLPRGCKVGEVAALLSPTEMATIQRQAVGQASRFEVLRKEDVDALSRVRRQKLFASN